MCNLYRLVRPAAEVARLFGVEAPTALPNAVGDIYPGAPALIVAGGALRSMVWGFPFARVGKAGQPLKPKPVNNARADKLASPFWRSSFAARRCLIPMTGFAEAEGPAGAKTRVWFAVPGEPVFAAAGIWRDSAEWGPVAAMVMTEACIDVAGVHDRMPVLIAPAERAVWLAGSAADAQALCRPWDGPMTVTRTGEPWAARGPSGGGLPSLPLALGGGG
jgi:putative SOS response-associated peptidase YedK